LGVASGSFDPFHDLIEAVVGMMEQHVLVPQNFKKIDM